MTFFLWMWCLASRFTSFDSISLLFYFSLSLSLSLCVHRSSFFRPDVRAVVNLLPANRRERKRNWKRKRLIAARAWVRSSAGRFIMNDEKSRTVGGNGNRTAFRWKLAAKVVSYNWSSFSFFLFFFFRLRLDRRVLMFSFFWKICRVVHARTAKLSVGN